MKKLLLAATLATTLVAPAFAITTADRIVAVVNNSVITQSELAQRQQEAITSLQRQNIALPPAEALSRQLLDQMINEQLQLQFAANNGLRLSELEVDESLQRIAKQNNTDLAGLSALLAKDNLTLDRLRQQVRRELLLERLRERELASRVSVSEQEVDQVLKSGGASNRREYRLAAIQVNLPERADNAQIETRRQKLLTALAEVKAGKPFAQVAASYSEGPTALQGGDLGWRSAGSLPADFVKLLDTLKPGEASDIVRAGGTLYVFQLVEQRDGNAQQLVQQHKVRHILVKINEATSEADAYARILQVQDRLKRGAKFEEVARQFSEDASATLGGDLGWLNQGDTVPDFERTFLKLKAGEVSEPVKSPFGWHILRLDEVRNQDVSGERERLAVKQQLRQRKLEQNYSDWLEQLRSSAFIDDRLIER